MARFWRDFAILLVLLSIPLWLLGFDVSRDVAVPLIAVVAVIGVALGVRFTIQARRGGYEE